MSDNCYNEKLDELKNILTKKLQELEETKEISNADVDVEFLLKQIKLNDLLEKLSSDCLSYKKNLSKYETKNSNVKRDILILLSFQNKEHDYENYLLTLVNKYSSEVVAKEFQEIKKVFKFETMPYVFKFPFYNAFAHNLITNAIIDYQDVLSIENKKEILHSLLLQIKESPLLKLIPVFKEEVVKTINDEHIFALIDGVTKQKASSYKVESIFRCLIENGFQFNNNTMEHLLAEESLKSIFHFAIEDVINIKKSKIKKECKI